MQQIEIYDFNFELFSNGSQSLYNVKLAFENLGIKESGIRVTTWQTRGLVQLTLIKIAAEGITVTQIYISSATFLVVATLFALTL